ncbi:nuclear factor 7, brain-like [Lacerta agilis]|uniref:nuclear factor 7, brain-like n=1 Tax=Lacerta agilis TaxID=80427 RepID=UPI0014196B47|nr:nuclear factor 7, brain-like [Lacerta agilis]
MASNLAEDLLCPICLSIFQEPHLLGCGHIFCLSCIKSCVPAGQDAGSCPECRRPFGLQELVSNRALGNVAQKARLLKLDGEPLPSAARDFCEEHEEPLKLFCRQDRVPICRICRDLPCHLGHKFLPIKNAVRYAQWRLNSILRNLENLLKTTGDAESFQLEEISEMENCTKGTLSHISREFEALHQILHEKEESFKKRVQEISKKNLQDMQNAITSLKDESSSYTDMIARIKAALETTNHVAFLKGFKQVMDKTAVGKDEGDNGEEEVGIEEECDNNECENKGMEDNSGSSCGIVMSAAVALEEFEASLDFDAWKRINELELFLDAAEHTICTKEETEDIPEEEVSSPTQQLNVWRNVTHTSRRPRDRSECLELQDRFEVLSLNMEDEEQTPFEDLSLITVDQEYEGI